MKLFINERVTEVFKRKEKKEKKEKEGMKKKVTYIGFNRQATEFTVGTTSGFYVYNEKSSDPTFRRGTYLTPLKIIIKSTCIFFYFPFIFKSNSRT